MKNLKVVVLFSAILTLFAGQASAHSTFTDDFKKVLEVAENLAKNGSNSLTTMMVDGEFYGFMLAPQNSIEKGLTVANWKSSPDIKTHFYFADNNGKVIRTRGVTSVIRISARATNADQDRFAELIGILADNMHRPLR